MAWDPSKNVGALMLLALMALVVLVSRLDGSAGVTDKGTDREFRPRVIVCKDKAGNYISCPPDVLRRKTR